jgi:hypothetical protein
LNINERDRVRLFACVVQQLPEIYYYSPITMDVDSTTTRLLTLLNASAVKPGKRKREEPPLPSEKLNKRKSVQFSEGLTEKENIAQVQEIEETADTLFEEIVDLEDGNPRGWSFFYPERRMF